MMREPSCVPQIFSETISSKPEPEKNNSRDSTERSIPFLLPKQQKRFARPDWTSTLTISFTKPRIFLYRAFLCAEDHRARLRRAGFSGRHVVEPVLSARHRAH